MARIGKRATGAGPAAGKRVFITGGASGLGLALAERYARDGWRVAVGDLHKERSAAAVSAVAAISAAGAAGAAVSAAGAAGAAAAAAASAAAAVPVASPSGASGAPRYLRCDVTREKDLEAAARWLEATWGGVDVVVNNAGVAVSGGIAETPLADWQWILDVGLLGVVRGCRVFTPLLRRLGGGRFVNVSSMAGLVHPPMMSAYSATKAAVVALSESLRVELAPDRIGVTVVCPGFFRTNLAETARASSGMEGVTRALVGRARRSAPEIAELVFQGVSRGDFLVLTHDDGKLVWMLKRALPFPLYELLMEHGSRRMLSRRPEPPPAPGRRRRGAR